MLEKYLKYNFHINIINFIPWTEKTSENSGRKKIKTKISPHAMSAIVTFT